MHSTVQKVCGVGGGGPISVFSLSLDQTEQEMSKSNPMGLQLFTL